MGTKYSKALHKKWHRQLKIVLAEHFTHPYCENCGSTQPPIDIAHSKKRFDIHSREDYFDVALLCRSCHNHFEWGSHDRMYSLIKEVIAKRGKNFL